MTGREFDIVLFGATGYTGKLCLEFIATALHSTLRGLKFALAGRCAAKVSKAAAAAGVSHLPVVEADSADAPSLDAMCARTRVVLSVVGPYCIHGMPLVEACVRAGTSLLDVTGEFTFMARVAERFHDETVRRHIYLVSCCGFDSLPSELTNMYVHRTAAALAAAAQPAASSAAGEGASSPLKIRHVSLAWQLRNAAGLSGGTADTTAHLLWTLKARDLHPLSILPSCARADAATTAPQDLRPFINPPGGFPAQMLVWRSALFDAWIAPWMMGGTNEKIVRKSNVLLGVNASYKECVSDPSFLMALAYVALIVLVPLLALPVVGRWLRGLLLPAAGEGPSREASSRSSFAALAAGFTDGAGATAPAIRVRMTSPHDAYVASAIMAVEAAAAVAKEEFGAEALRRGSSWAGGGVVTPGALVGEALMRRLGHSGITWAHTTEQRWP